MIFATVLVLLGVMNRIWESSTIMSATYAFAAGVVYLATAVLIALCGPEPLRRGGPAPEERVRAIPAASFGAAVLGLGAGGLAVGFVFGAAILIAGGALIVAGALLTGRELREQRRALLREQGR